MARTPSVGTVNSRTPGVHAARHVGAYWRRSLENWAVAGVNGVALHGRAVTAPRLFRPVKLSKVEAARRSRPVVLDGPRRRSTDSLTFRKMMAATGTAMATRAHLPTNLQNMTLLQWWDGRTSLRWHGTTLLDRVATRGPPRRPALFYPSAGCFVVIRSRAATVPSGPRVSVPRGTTVVCSGALNGGSHALVRAGTGSTESRRGRPQAPDRAWGGARPTCRRDGAPGSARSSRSSWTARSCRSRCGPPRRRQISYATRESSYTALSSVARAPPASSRSAAPHGPKRTSRSSDGMPRRCPPASGGTPTGTLPPVRRQHR